MMINVHWFVRPIGMHGMQEYKYLFLNNKLISVRTGALVYAISGIIKQWHRKYDSHDSWCREELLDANLFIL